MKYFKRLVTLRINGTLSRNTCI